MRESFAELGQEMFWAINPFKLSNLQHLLAVLCLLNWKRQELNVLRGRRTNLHLPPSGCSSKHGSTEAYFYFSKRLYPKLVTSTKPVRRLLSETVVCHLNYLSSEFFFWIIGVICELFRLLYIVKLSRRPNSVKYSRARSRIRWLNGGTDSALVIRAHKTDDEDGDGTRNARLLAIHPPDAAACPKIFYYSSFALLISTGRICSGFDIVVCLSC